MEEEYYVRTSPDGDWEKVSKQEYVWHERRAGLHNTIGQPYEPATASFALYRGDEYIAGRTWRDED